MKSFTHLFSHTVRILMSLLILSLCSATVPVRAASAACTYAVSPTSQNVPSGGGFYTANVGTTADCAWTAVSDSETWVKITSVVGRFGNGPINYTVAPNTGAARTAHISFADKQFTITQEAGKPWFWQADLAHFGSLIWPT